MSPALDIFRKEFDNFKNNDFNYIMKKTISYLRVLVGAQP